MRLRLRRLGWILRLRLILGLRELRLRLRLELLLRLLSKSGLLSAKSRLSAKRDLSSRRWLSLLRLPTLLWSSGDTGRACGALSVFRQVVDEFPLVILYLLVINLDPFPLNRAGHAGQAGPDLHAPHRLVGPR